MPRPRKWKRVCCLPENNVFGQLNHANEARAIVIMKVEEYEAITLNDYIDGKLELFKSNDSVFSTAKLKMGSGTSGMLVSEVKKQLTPFKDNIDLAIIDGSPGIGCPVIPPSAEWIWF
jgi:MinD superfamily P-loop ATPase